MKQFLLYRWELAGFVWQWFLVQLIMASAAKPNNHVSSIKGSIYLSSTVRPLFSHMFLILRSTGKRPDGVTPVLWKCGKLFVWDATYPDTLFQPFHSSLWEVASLADHEERKSSKYSTLPWQSHTPTLQ